MDFTLRATTHIDAPPAEVFDLITDIERLPDWNLEIPAVVTTPSALEPGAEWVVSIHAMKTRWNSRSRALEVDRERGRFAYRSQSDDGNPSHADWTWQLAPAGTTAGAPAAGAASGTDVTVEVAVHPRTFIRKWLLSELRKSGLRKAMNESLLALRERAHDRRNP